MTIEIDDEVFNLVKRYSEANKIYDAEFLCEYLIKVGLAHLTQYWKPDEATIIEDLSTNSSRKARAKLKRIEAKHENVLNPAADGPAFLL